MIFGTIKPRTLKETIAATKIIPATYKFFCNSIFFIPIYSSLLSTFIYPFYSMLVVSSITKGKSSNEKSEGKNLPSLLAYLF